MSEKRIPMVTTINWYRREDYPRILEVMEDRHLLPADSDAWLKSAETGLKHLQDRGIVALKMEIHPEPFLVWCREGARQINASARNDYAGALAIKLYREKGGH